MDEKQLAAMRLVSSRYHELQGLRAALIGMSFAVTMTAALALGGADGDETSVMLALGASALLIVPGMLWLDRYYARTFGRSVPSRAERRWSTLVVPLTLVALMFIGEAVGQGKTLFFVGFAVFELWILVRDWPWRPHYVGGVAASLGAAVVLWMGASRDAGEPLMWAFLLFGVSQVPLGLADHLLLQRTLSGSRLSPERAH